MKKIEHITCFYVSVFLFCFKRSQIKFNSLFDYENLQQKRITKHCKNHSVDVDYKDFMKI